MNDILTEDFEILRFMNEFFQFKQYNQIDVISDTMDFEKWNKSKLFIFAYIYKLHCQNKIKTLLTEYGIREGIDSMITFYKNEFNVKIDDSNIMNFILNSVTNKEYDKMMLSFTNEIALVILLEAVDFPYNIKTGLLH